MAFGLAIVWAGTMSVGGAGSLPQRLWAISQEGMPDIFASAFGAGTFIAAGKHGAIYSLEGKVYTDPAGRDIQGIVYSFSAPLPQFVAVGVGWAVTAPAPIILTSLDGLTWTERAAPPSTRSLFAVTYGNGLYAAVGNGGDIITSPDGINWTARTSGTTEQLRGVAWLGVFVAVGQNRTVLTSPDGVTWTPQTAPAGIGSDLNAVAHNGTLFIAVSSGQGIMTSPDGVTWTQQSVPDTIPGQDFEAVAVGFLWPTVVVGDNRIYSSVDGVTWELRFGGPPVPSNGEGRFHQTVTNTPFGFAALGLGGSIFFSADAILWASLTVATSREWNDVAHGNGGFCAVGWSGAIASSPDGQVFTNRSGPSDFNLLANAIAWGEDPGRFVAVSGSNARIHASSDCATFETVSHGDGFTPATGITGSLSDVVYGAEDGLFVAVGQEETGEGTGFFIPLVATSSDGLSWTQTDTGAPSDGVRSFDNVGYGDGRFVAIGLDSGDGTRLLYTSEDGIGWSAQSAPFDAFELIEDIAFANGVFVAVGDRIWTSPEGINWTPRVDYDPAFRVFTAVAFGDGRFVAPRQFGGIFVSADGVSWEEHPGASSFDQRGIAFSENLNRFVIVGESIILRTDDPILSFSPASYDVTEGTLTRNVTVNRTGSVAAAASFDYATSDGTALAGQDYTAKSARLTIAAGKSSATIAIPILNDTFDEALDETFTVSMSNPSAGVFLGVDEATVNIQDNDQGGTLELGVESLKVTEGKVPVKVKVPVSRTGTAPLAGSVGVTFTTFGGTALPGEDYTEVTQTLTFPAGVTTVSAEVTILPDAIDENDEVFGVRIVAPSEGADLGELTTALVKVVDDDSGGSVQFLAPTYSGTEGVGSGQVLVKVQRTGGLATASVELSIDSSTATLGDDFTLAAGELDFAAGQTLLTVPLAILNDPLGEPPETVTLKLENPTGGASLGPRSTTVVTVKDNEPAIQFALAASSVAEQAGSVKVAVSRTAGPGPVTVDYGVTGGNAVSPDDFGPAAGTLSFASTELSKILTIPIVNDGEGEGIETFVLGLSNPGGASIGARSTTTISINDNEPAVQFALAASSVAEQAGSVKVTVSRTAGPGPVTVDYGVTGGTAVSPDDFGPVAGSLSFATNELSKILTIPIVNDGDGEGLETFVLGLSNPGGGYIGARSSTTVTIKDNEPVVQFALAAYKALEAAGSVKVIVSRTPGPGPVTVDYGVTGGNAVPPDDFGPVAGTLNFATNELSKILTIPIVNDAEGEGDETFVLGLSNPAGASIGARGSTTVTIGDSEPSAKLSLASYKAVSEAVATHVATFQVTRVGNLAVPFTVDYRTENGTAEASQDYLPASGTLSFAAKQVSQMVNVTLVDDDLGETGETIRVLLENPVGASLGSIAEAVLNVTSNDDPGTLVLSPLSSSLLEPGDGSSVLFPFTVKRKGKAPLAAISVGVLLTPFASTATDGADFVFIPGNLDFAAGETEKTFEVEILGDATGCEGLETLGLSIQGSGALPPKVSAGQTVLGIADRSLSFLGPFSAAGTLSATGTKGTCTWQDAWAGTVLLNVSCPGAAGNVATVRATRVLNQGVPSGPGLACPSTSEQRLFSIPLEDDGTDFLGALAGNPSVTIEGTRSGSTAGGNLTFSFMGSTTGDSAGTFTATKQ
jgi:hypothetical protein